MLTHFHTHVQNEKDQQQKGKNQKEKIGTHKIDFVFLVLFPVLCGNGKVENNGKQLQFKKKSRHNLIM